MKIVIYLINMEIYKFFLKGSMTGAGVFLDIEGAYHNVVP